MKPLAQNTLIQSRYLIVHLIGKGGMGEVYLAVDQRLGSAVALKRTFFAGDEMLGTAFEREARILARMRHPALPKVSDHFTENQEQYLVMEHISGDDLAKRLEQSGKPFPVSWVMFWADQLLDALSYLHSHEPPIIHRDIKPQNLKLTDENYIILLDFGLSKSSTGNTHITAPGSPGSTGSTGSVVGYTPHYAPMEQIRGIGTNARSDLYSLSATLYQLVTNTVPPDALTRADALLNGSPDPIRPPHEINPEVPQNVSTVILRGMEVSQERRFGTAREMQRELRQAFSRLQEVMSAQTVAFNAHSEGLGTLEVPGIAALPPQAQKSISQPGSGGQGDSIPKGDEPLDMDATLAFDPSARNSEPRQSDIKTEVFLRGDSPLSIPEQVPASRPSGDFFEIDNDAVLALDSQPRQNGPQATVPFVSLDDRGEVDETAPQDGATNFYTTPGATSQPEQFATVAADAGTHASQPVQETAPVAVVKTPAKKSGTSKAIAILGGMAALFILILGAAGAGWYFYSTRNAGVVETEATPSSAPSLEATPIPTPSIETAVESNTSVETNTNTNTATPPENLVEATPAPSEPGTTPVSRQGTTNPGTPPKQTQPGVPKNTPAKPAPTPVIQKPTPKKEDKGVILQ